VVLGVTFLTVCFLYAAALLSGWRRAKHGRLDVTMLVQTRRAFIDPLTRRFQQWGQREKMNALRQKRWFRLWLLISANNLGAVAFVGRTLYGVALVPAVYFTYRQGLTHGTFLAQPSIRPRGEMLQVMVLEFGAYLLATALGVNLVMTPLTGGVFTDALASLLTFYPVVAAALLAGAWLEVRALRSQMPAGLQIPENLTVEELRAKAMEMIKRRSGHDGPLQPGTPHE
jgi:hypothetical protein